jgi:phytol kinase
MKITFLGMACILAASCLLTLAVRLAHLRGWARPEVLRKLTHAGMGSILLSCPFFFERFWPVAALSALFVALMGLRRWWPLLNRHLSPVVDGVSRSSAGEFYFPLAVALLFVLAGANHREYCLPLALLSYADAAAALVGTRWGRCFFATPGGRKSVEGCTAFFLVALSLGLGFLLVRRPALPMAAMLIALNIALLTTLMEAVSWRGLDNLAIPLSAWAMLHFLETPSGALFFASLFGGAALLLLTTPWRSIRRMVRSADPTQVRQPL